MKKIRDLRNQHSHDSLIREKLDPDPFVQFETWIYAALESEPGEPNAMTLATISKDGRPSTRVVLLRGIEEGGFSFYTNYCSRKARDIEQNNNVALSFYWASLLRQVRIEGVAEKLSADASDKYFRSRPRGSKIGAWASAQSDVINNRSELESAMKSYEERFSGLAEVPRPDFWGGYCVKPKFIEFWQGRENRLHDRFRYSHSKNGWIIERLAP